MVVEAREVLSRYRPGGVAHVLQVHGDGFDRKYDVKYVLGGREKNVDARYVSLQERAGSGPAVGNGRTGPKDKDQTPSSKRSSPRVHSTAESSPLVQASSSKAQKQSQSKSKKPTESNKRKAASMYNDEEEMDSEEENSASSSEQESRRPSTTRSLNSPGRDVRGVKRARPSRAGRYGGSYADVVSSPLLTEGASSAKRPRRHGTFVGRSPRLRGSPRFRDPLQLLI